MQDEPERGARILIQDEPEGEESGCWGLIISMDDSEATSLEQIRAFLAGSGEVRFAGQRREEVYGWVEKTLVRHQYASLDRPGKGLVRRYIARMTGLSRAQVTRLITGYGKTGRVKAAAYQRTKFATRYTAADVDLLAYVDKAHGNLSGPATRRILEREYGEYGQAAYQRLAAISVAHLYRLRNSAAYRKRNTSYQPTRPTPIPIGERRKPQPHGVPGYLRIDTVHQGDQDGRKGLYHINAVDQVTQWEIVAAAPQISELLADAGAGSHARAVSVRDPRLSFRQRQRVHQLHRGPAAEQTADRTDQVAGASLRRQRFGGIQERSHHPQAHRFRLHRCADTPRRWTSFIAST